MRKRVPRRLPPDTKKGRAQPSLPLLRCLLLCLYFFLVAVFLLAAFFVAGFAAAAFFDVVAMVAILPLPATSLLQLPQDIERAKNTVKQKNRTGT